MDAFDSSIDPFALGAPKKPDSCPQGGVISSIKRAKRIIPSWMRSIAELYLGNNDDTVPYQVVFFSALLKIPNRLIIQTDFRPSIHENCRILFSLKNSFLLADCDIVEIKRVECKTLLPKRTYFQIVLKINKSVDMTNQEFKISINKELEKNLQEIAAAA